MASGTCTWTYHPPAGMRKGYWTVVDNCTSGSCTAALKTSGGADRKAPAGLEVDHDEFARKVEAEYKARGKKLSDEQKRALASPKANEDFVMDCV